MRGHSKLLSVIVLSAILPGCIVKPEQVRGLSDTDLCLWAASWDVFEATRNRLNDEIRARNLDCPATIDAYERSPRYAADHQRRMQASMALIGLGTALMQGNHAAASPSKSTLRCSTQAGQTIACWEDEVQVATCNQTPGGYLCTHADGAVDQCSMQAGRLTCTRL